MKSENGGFSVIPLPWSYVNLWRCIGCGLCCINYDVVLNFDEWLRIVQRFGVGATRAGLNKLYLGKKPDGSCIFLSRIDGKYVCTLQDMKPIACKLWPFRILNWPKHGKAREALFNYKGRRLYVYIDPSCPGIRWGKPSSIMVNHVIPEFIEIALGIRKKQVHSTGRLLYSLDVRRKISGLFAYRKM